MKIGDLVTLKESSRDSFAITSRSPGIILDTLEMSDGFTEYEVMFEDWGVGWFSDLMLTPIPESDGDN